MILNVSFGKKNYPKAIPARNKINGPGQAEHEAWVNYFNSHLSLLKPSEDGDTYEPQCGYDDDEEEETGYYSNNDADAFYRGVDQCGDLIWDD